MADINYDDVIGYMVRIERVRYIEKVTGSNSGDLEDDENDNEDEEP